MQVYYNGVYSIDITIGTKTYNTWKDLHLIPEERPIIMPPQPNIVIEEIPTDYFIDLSSVQDNSLSYVNRTGTWNFIVDHNGWNSWSEAYDFILNNIHGKKARIRLKNYDDIDYTGYLEISSYSSEEEYSKISLTYYIMDNTIRNDRFPESIIEDYEDEISLDDYPSPPGPVLIDTDIIDYQEGPNSDFSGHSGLIIEYDEVGPEIPDPGGNYDPVQYSTDPEPYTEDGWELCAHGYMSPEGGIHHMDDNREYEMLKAGPIVYLGTKRSDGGIKYRVHIYTKDIYLKYYIIDQDSDGNTVIVESNALNRKKYNDCYKLYTNNVTLYLDPLLNNGYDSVGLNIGMDYDPNYIFPVISYFIYIETVSTEATIL